MFSAVNADTQDGCVYQGVVAETRRCIVKSIRQGSEEVSIYRQLQRTVASPVNHTLPCEIVGSEADRDLLILPFVEESRNAPSDEWPLSKVVGFVYEILEVGLRWAPLF